MLDRRCRRWANIKPAFVPGPDIYLYIMYNLLYIIFHILFFRYSLLSNSIFHSFEAGIANAISSFK